MPIASAQTAPDISDLPLFLNSGVPPLNMIVLGRDHKLYYEAYNDSSDLNNDGVLDTRYKPTIDYFGYFDAYKCYSHAGGTGNMFVPTRTTADKRCTVADTEWSGGEFPELRHNVPHRCFAQSALRRLSLDRHRGVDSARAQPHTAGRA